jgi:hypothetical protein
MQHIVPYAPRKNVVAERKNYTLKGSPFLRKYQSFVGKHNMEVKDQKRWKKIDSKNNLTVKSN